MSEVEFEGQGENFENVEFDINDPALATWSPNVDPEEIPKQLRPAPPPDGIHWAKLRLNPNREGGAVYIKGSKVNGRIVDGKVIVAIDARVYNRETGEEGAFLKNWYATTQVFKGAKGSQVTAICYLAGYPVKAGASLLDIKNHVEKVFAEAGEGGVLLPVKTRWDMSVPKTQPALDSEGQPTGLLTYVYKEGTDIKEYDTVKGEAKIKKLAALRGIPEERAHLFQEPVTGEERSAQAEIQNVEDPSLFEEVG